MKEFIMSLPLDQQKMFITGMCSNLTEYLSSILTDEQKTLFINEVNVCYSDEEQEEIVNKYCESINKELSRVIDTELS